MKKFQLIIAFAAVVCSGVLFFPDFNESKPQEKKLSRLERKKLRSEYFFNKLKDPKTNEIPSNVRMRELRFAQELKKNHSAARTANTSHTWAEVGPSNIGGRTRALALDLRDSDIVFAGGVSGGIWKSEDGGTTWSAKLSSGSHLSISSIAQDPNQPDTWYATTGEVQDGGSARGKGQGGSFYFGTGIYKSTDNGENWTFMSYADEDGDDVFARENTPDDRIASYFVHPFHFTAKILIQDMDGVSNIFVTTQYEGIWLSTDGGDTFERFGAHLTGDELPYYSDIVIDDEDILTVWFGPTSSGNNGFFRSYDGGSSFEDVTPDDYPQMGDGARAVCALSPSNPAIMYAFVYDGAEDEYLFQFDFTNLDNGGGSFSSEDRTVNLPEYDESIFGGPEEFTTQGGYDMALAVHPENPQLVVLGYVNLIRSDDGFASAVTDDPARSWIGGNDNPWLLDEDYSFETQGVHHADQHIVIFDPKNPDVLLSGHDGGLSKTADITADRVIWESLNNDYNVTQFYTVSAGFSGGDSYIIGGTQDNGSPMLDHSSFSSNLIPSVGDLSSGDGAFCYAGGDIIYSSAQEGWISVFGVAAENMMRYVYRSDVQTLFVHPFAVDPNDEGTLFYSTFGDGILARNTTFDEGVSADDIDMINNGWEDFTYGDAVAVSAIRVSDQNPSHKLYFGGTLDDEPVLFSWENANTGDDVNDMEMVVLDEVELGAWLSDIAINPKNGNEIMLVYSNYNIVGLYHSTDGGQTITAVEGNLSENDDLYNEGYSGPSLRAAEIIEDDEGNKKYVVATSIGVFSASSLDGMNTTWQLETELLDNVVIEDLDYRKEDGAIVAGTHGRGIFLGSPGEAGSTNSAPSIADQSFRVDADAAIGTSVGTIEASDPNGDALSYSIVGGNIDNAFALDATTGELTVNNTLDFETNANYELAVAVNDGELSSEATITIRSSQDNQAPSISDQTFEVNEDAATGTLIGTIEAADSDGDALSFNLVSGNTADAFVLDEATGELMVNGALSYETKSTYALTVEVSDGVEISEALITVNVTEANSAPSIADQSFAIDENLEIGAVIGIVEASDPDEDELSFVITAGNTGDAFVIDETSGELSVNSTLDYDDQSEYVLTVEVSDGSLSGEANIFIDLNEVLSLKENLSGISIYPNPVVGNQVTVELDQTDMQNLEIMITDLLGRRMFTQNRIEDNTVLINTSGFKQGYYLLSIRTSAGTYSQRLLVR